jgi:hypothetical protein
MGIQVNMPYPGETFQSTIKLDVFDDEGNSVRTDNEGTWYECTKVDVKVEKGEGFNPDIQVIARIRRLDDESEFLDEADFAVIYREEWFTM